MNDATLAKLEFDHVRESLASRCATTLGKQLAHRLRPSTRRDQVVRWINQVRELLLAADAIGLPPLAGVRDIRADVHDSSRPSGVEPEGLARVGETLAATAHVQAWAAALPPDCVLLRMLTDRVGDFTPLARMIDDVVDARGRVRDTASPKLASIRATISRAEVQIKTVFERLLRQSSVQRTLQYEGATFHGDRMVLPLKAEHRGRIAGIIHRSSDSGATLFVEPAEVVEINNAITRLRCDEHEEITRILFNISRAIHLNAEPILRSLDALAVLDLTSAKVRYARDRDAVCPEIRPDRKLDLRQARHPVLVETFLEETPGIDSPRHVVPIDVRLGDDFDVLVITGPNTGGKTLALKTVGLLSVMAHAGIPIPAAPGSALPVYRHVFIDVGDEQSIEQSLSTYSGHLSNILAILRQVTPDSLVLLDELGAGTDPDEGAAIGRAVMDELLRRNCSAVVTTHLSALKGVAFTQQRVDNASVEFDVASLRPTFHLRIGEPGNSNAITIAERLGMPPRMVERARLHVARRQQALNQAIEGTLRIRRQAEKARTEARQARLEAEHWQREYERQVRELDSAKATYREWLEWVNALRPGDSVFVKSFRRQAKVVRPQLHRQTVLVTAGAMDIEVPLTDLTRMIEPQ